MLLISHIFMILVASIALISALPVLDSKELPVIRRIDLGLALSADTEVNDDGESIGESRVGESEPELATRSLVPAETDDVGEDEELPLSWFPYFRETEPPFGAENQGPTDGEKSADTIGLGLTDTGNPEPVSSKINSEVTKDELEFALEGKPEEQPKTIWTFLKTIIPSNGKKTAEPIQEVELIRKGV